MKIRPLIVQEPCHVHHAPAALSVVRPVDSATVGPTLNLKYSSSLGTDTSPQLQTTGVAPTAVPTTLSTNLYAELPTAVSRQQGSLVPKVGKGAQLQETPEGNIRLICHTRLDASDDRSYSSVRCESSCHGYSASVSSLRSSSSSDSYSGQQYPFKSLSTTKDTDKLIPKGDRSSVRNWSSFEVEGEIAAIMGPTQSRRGQAVCTAFVEDGRKVPINDGFSFTGDESTKSGFHQSEDRSQDPVDSFSRQEKQIEITKHASVADLKSHSSKRVLPSVTSNPNTIISGQDDYQEISELNSEPFYLNIDMPARNSTEYKNDETSTVYVKQCKSTSHVVRDIDSSANYLEQQNISTDPINSAESCKGNLLLSRYRGDSVAVADDYLVAAGADAEAAEVNADPEHFDEVNAPAAAWTSTGSESAYETIRSKDRRLDEAVASSFEFYCTASRDARAVGYVSSEQVTAADCCVMRCVSSRLRLQ